MPLSDRELEFLRHHRAAAMTTIGADGVPKVARVGVVAMDGKLWSSGTQDRVRTRRLRRDPRCTMFVFDAATPSWLAVEGTVEILEGPDVPQQSLLMFREMQGKPTGPLSWFGGDLDEAAFLQTMIEEQRLIYELTPHRTYGAY